MREYLDKASGYVVAGQHLRHFTVDHANRSLVLVKRIVADIVVDYGRLLDLQEMAEAAEATGDDQQCRCAKIELTAVVEKLRIWLDELETVGVELVDWSLGIVDFPCVVGGREIRLCWQYGQERVEHWCEVGADFASRQPIETLTARGVLANN